MLEHNHIPEMVSEVVRGKALASIVEARHRHRRVRQPVELKNLQPDGSIGDPAEAEAAAAAESAASTTRSPTDDAAADDATPERLPQHPRRPAHAPWWRGSLTRRGIHATLTP